MSNYKNLIIGSKSGIGQALAEKLKLQDEKVLHIYRKSDSENILDLAKAHKQERIKTLFYCLGTIKLKSILGTTADQLQEDFKVNLVYAHEIIKLFYRELLASNGSIIFYSSVAAKKGFSFHSSIASSKSAIEGYVRSISAEMAPKVRANAIRLSLANTPLSDFIFSNEKSKKIALSMQPSDQFITLRDIATLSLEISRNKSITGQVITLDGGLVSLFKKPKV